MKTIMNVIRNQESIFFLKTISNVSNAQVRGKVPGGVESLKKILVHHETMKISGQNIKTGRFFSPKYRVFFSSESLLQMIDLVFYPAIHKVFMLGSNNGFPWGCM